MRVICSSALLAALIITTAQIAPFAQGQGRGRGAQSPEAQAAAAKYAAADIRVVAPGVIINAGLPDLAAAYSKMTGKNVAVTTVGMGTIVNAVKTANPPADVIFLPLELMSSL